MATGNPLNDTEIWPIPAKYHYMINTRDPVSAFVGVRGGPGTIEYVGPAVLGSAVGGAAAPIGIAETLRKTMGRGVQVSRARGELFPPNRRLDALRQAGRAGQLHSRAYRQTNWLTTTQARQTGCQASSQTRHKARFQLAGFPTSTIDKAGRARRNMIGERGDATCGLTYTKSAESRDDRG